MLFLQDINEALEDKLLIFLQDRIAKSGFITN